VGASGTLTLTKGWTRQYPDVVVNRDGVDETDEFIVISPLEPTHASVGGLWGPGSRTTISRCGRQ